MTAERLGGAPHRPAVSAVPHEARAYQGRPAGVVSRLLAACADFVVLLAGMAAVYLAYAGVLFMWDPQGFQFPRPTSGGAVTAGSVLFTLYLATAWAVTGRTYGDQVLGLRVVSRSGRRLRPGVALLRALFYVVFPIGLLWCAVNRRSRSVQDVVLRSSVVYDWTRHTDDVAG